MELKLTLVTCLFDLGRREGGSPRQSVEFYLEQGRAVLGLDADLIIFTDPDLVEPLEQAAKAAASSYNRVIARAPFEDLPAYGLRSAVERARVTHPLRTSNPVKDTPLYGVFQRAKVQLLPRAMALDPFGASHFAWIDFGIGKVATTNGARAAFERALALETVELLAFAPLSASMDWQRIRQNVLAGYIAGSRDALTAFCRAYEEEADGLLEEGYAPHDETLLEFVALQHPELVTVRQVRDYTRVFFDDNPLLGLAMIVKNEAHGIVETLVSLRSYIDRWTILDTGSTDGTQDLIHRTLAGVPGELHEEPFVDFSTSRNRALELHGTSTAFVLMPDSDDVLVDGEALRRFCATHESASGGAHEAYLVNIRRGELDYWLPLVMRTGAAWRYKGRVHEYAGREGAPPASVRIPGAQLRQAPKPESRDASRARWERDLHLLRADLLADPKNPRTAFYLGQTFECLGRPEDALRAYEHRIDLGGWPDETFEAKLRRAKVLDALKRPWPEVQQAYLEAHAFDPRRAEPLYAVARHWYDAEEHGLSYLFAKRAMELPKPQTSLFLDGDVYEWKAADTTAISAFYLADKLNDPSVHAIGKRAADRAVKGRPDDERLRNNRMFYVRSATELFSGFTHQPVHFEPEEPFVPTNPSIWYDGERWRCVIRTTNYRLVDGHYLVGGQGADEGNPIWTRNYMAELADDLSVERVVEMVERVELTRAPFPVHGFEDCRLFGVDGRFFCSSTVCDLNDHEGREIGILTLDEDYAISDVTIPHGLWSHIHQKNWMPLVRDGAVFFIYSTVPTTVVGYDGNGTIDLRGATVLSYGRLRGGSQAVRVPGGWLFLVHDVTFGGGRTYLHRFVFMSDDFEVTRMSDLFYFVERKTEFCAGLGYDGERLVASFGVGDHAARLGIFQLDSVLAQLREDFVV